MLSKDLRIKKDWKRSKRREAKIALFVGGPFVAFCVAAAYYEAPTWLFITGVMVGLAVLMFLEYQVMRCPSCKVPLGRPPIQEWGKPQVCPECSAQLT